MKQILVILLALASCTHVVQGQERTPIPTQLQALPPQLEEWYSLRGDIDEKISFIPNFKNNEALSAIVVLYNGKTQTWYNQMPFDTINRYTWNFYTADLRLMDFNGDRIRDYFKRTGEVYLGSISGLPTDTVDFKIGAPGNTVIAGHRQNDIGDFNNDGSDDFYFIPYTPSDVLLNCWFGTKGASNNKVRRTQLTRVAHSNGTSEVALVMYKTNSGKTRLLTAEWKEDAFTKGYYYPEYNQVKLYSVESTTTPDTVTFALSLLDSANNPEWRISKYEREMPFTIGEQFLYSSRTTGARTLHFGARCFILTDNIDMVNGYIIDTRTAKMLDHSIDGDSIEDVVSASFTRGIDNVVQRYVGVWKANEEGLVEKYAQIAYPSGFGNFNECLSIGDVTGDGISDVAITFHHIDSGTIFRIVKGANIPVGVQEREANQEAQLSPNPVRSGGVLRIDGIESTELFKLELCTTHGEIFPLSTHASKFVDAQTLQIQLPSLSQGLYVLKVQNDNTHRSYKVLVVE